MFFINGLIIDKIIEKYYPSVIVILTVALSIIIAGMLK